MAPSCSLAALANRDLTFLSGMFAVVAAKCLHSMIAPTGEDTVATAIGCTVTMLIFFFLISVWFIGHKKKIEEGRKDASIKSGDLELAVDEASDHLTGAMGAIVAIMWFGLFPDGMKEWYSTTVILLIGSIILVILECIDRSLTKGGVCKHFLGLVQSGTQGTFAWHIGNAMNVYWKDVFGVPPEILKYWMYFVIVLAAAAHLEIFGSISQCCCQSGASKAYADTVMKMIKTAPMKSAHLFLRDLVEQNWAPHLFGASAVWTLFTLPFLYVLEVLRKSVPSCGTDDGVADKYALEVVSIMSQCFGFLCGQLFGDAYIAWLTGSTWFGTDPIGAQRFIFGVSGFAALLLSILLMQVRLSGTADSMCGRDDSDEEDAEDLLAAAE
jgi:hypothetical protein